MSDALTTRFVAEAMREAGFRVIEGPEREITGGAADSRLVAPGDLFGAFRGESLDGNDFVAEALEAGAVAAVCERLPERWPEDRTLVEAPSTVTALHELARAWRDECGPQLVGITGTVGKTTAKELLAAVLGRFAPAHRSPGNFNSREGLPLALMSLRRDHAYSVLEMAMDSRGEIAELAAVARPDAGIVLNAGATHAAKVGSIEVIAEEKLSLVRSLCPEATALLNADDERIAAAKGSLPCRTLTFGTAADADVRASAVEDRGREGVAFDVTCEGRTVRGHSPLPGVHVLPAALAAIGAATALGIGLRDAVEAVGGASIPGRLRWVTAGDGVTILDDTYNASPASMAGDLELLRQAGGRRIALLGVMAELGEYEEAEHRRIGRLAAGCCDMLAAVGEPCRFLVEQAQAAGLREARWFADKDEAARFVREASRPGDHVLLKASRSQAFETLLPILEGTAG